MPANASPKAAARPKALYSPHPSLKVLQDWIDTLKAKTGRSLPEWVAFIRKQGPGTQEARRDWLKAEHKLGANSAWWLAERSVGKNEGEEDPAAYLARCPAWVDAMYAGKKAALRPIHDRIIALARQTIPAVKICPCQTIVPLFRTHVIAQIKPATNTRIDLGFALGPMLKAAKPGARSTLPARLIDTGGFAKKDRITHRMALSGVEEVDHEVAEWLKKAYELDTD